MRRELFLSRLLDRGSARSGWHDPESSKGVVFDESPRPSPSLRDVPPQSTRFQLLRRVHHDQRGAVTLETVLIIAAIALPILIFVLKFAWPKISEYFNQGMQNLENESNDVINGSGSGTTP